jgi:hypothetical protein
VTHVETIRAGFAAHNRGDVGAPFAFVLTFKGERVVREQAFRNREEALEAAGLSE